ncbi:ATP-binding protein [Streptomyces profundus]|uniref:ATP-binding protein n=1 Tax=Streptomyces profundus TaxID=2867410 RepID=UPI001D160459|nr:ATP-binding protein [Streptomyces sp. MA3_2.13]UED85206.1 ATP-binding protein [Streptomyces sp. MA3_2.13]
MSGKRGKECLLLNPRRNSWNFTFPGNPEEVSRARRLVRDVLSEIPCREDAALVVSELAANAITHTRSHTTGFTVHITRTPRTVTISVTDHGGSTSRPRVAHATDSSPCGRGLVLVTACATVVRITGDETGHTVTAELHVNVSVPAPC